MIQNCNPRKLRTRNVHFMELGESDRQIRGPNRVNEENKSFSESWFYLDYFNFNLITLLKRTVRGRQKMVQLPFFVALFLWLDKGKTNVEMI